LKKGAIIASVQPEKVGKGALFWILSSNDDYIYANKFFASCDGKILSSSIDLSVSVEDDVEKRLIEVYNLIGAIDPSSRTGVIDFLDFDDSDLSYKSLIKSSIKDICIRAKMEKRGEQIPLSDTAWQKDDSKTITAFLPGTFSRGGNVVEGWFKSYEVLRKEYKKSDGSIFYMQNGKPLYLNSIKDKSYVMLRWAYDCKSNKSSISQSTDYNNFGEVLRSKSYGVNFTDVVPNSVGEAILNSICKIY
jgi:hypothetical protein